jgi:hypothetical protein
MRSFKLTVAIAAAASLLALAATGTSARPLRHGHASPTGKCRVDAFAEPHSITSGESVQIFGRLLCPGGGNEGQTVSVYGSSVATPGFKVLGTPTTTAGGFYSLVEPDVTSDSRFYASALGAVSGTKTVRVAPVVTLSGPSEKQALYTGFRNRITFTGAVSPADAGALLVLQRENATSFEEWHVIQLGHVALGGAYSITHTFVVPGDANIRIVVRPHRKVSVRGVSNTLSYGISQRENPNLTINTTAYSAPYATPVTISGILAGAGAGKPVTLVAHTYRSTATLVGNTTTTTGGAYSFVVSPLQNTTYQVTAGAVKSAILFQGVKYILTAGVSATTVQAGQALTFSGTVTPGAGRLVYLERENGSGGGFHVVNIAGVEPNGTYSITDYPFGTGKVVFRVKAPGNPDNQQASSALFPVEVTAGPANLLVPATQPKVPSEGTI